MSTETVLLSLVLALQVGTLAAGARNRKRFAGCGRTFRCKVRWADDPRWTVAPHWPRHKVRASWIHDVLLVHRGILRPRTEALAAHAPDRAIRKTVSLEVTGLGANPVVFGVRLDDGQMVDVAARDTDVVALVGPFLAAAIPGLPEPPADRWPTEP